MARPVLLASAFLFLVLAFGCGGKGEDKPAEDNPGGSPVVPGGDSGGGGVWAASGKWETTEKLILTSEQAKQLVPGSLRVSPDGTRVAYALKDGDKARWVVDGKPGEAYEKIDPKNFVFSADSKHYLYSASSTRYEYDRIRQLSVNVAGDELYLNGKRVAGGLMQAHNLFLTRDGKHFAYDGDGQLYIDGKSVHTHRWQGGKWGVISAVETIRWTDGSLVDGQKITAPGKVTEFQFSANGKTFAYLTTQDGQTFAVINGKPQKRFDKVDLNRFNEAQQPLLLLSADGEHDIHPGQEGKKFYVSHDNTWHELDGQPSVPLTLSPDGKRWACRVSDNRNKGAVWIDGKKGKVYETVCGHDQGRDVWAVKPGLPTVAFSPDSKQAAYAAGMRVTDEKAKDRGRYYAFMVRDEKEQKEFAWVSREPVFSPDARFLAYFASDKLNGEGERFLTVDGMKVGKPYATFHDKVGATFSPDSKSVGFVAKERGESFAVLDGQEQKGYDAIGPDGSRVGFAPSGAYTFVAVRGGGYYWVEARRK